jgi:hypothetical protein
MVQGGAQEAQDGAVAADQMNGDAHVRERISQWLSGSPTWFALEAPDAFCLIVCGDGALARFLSRPMPSADTADSVAAVAACREYLEVTQRPCHRVKIGSGMYAHFGMRAELSSLATVAGPPS